MQTILGANGIIGEELAKELRYHWTTDIKLVGRNPKKVHRDDILHSADLSNLNETKEAVEGSEITYLTVGLPYNSEVWLRDWPLIVGNAIEACIEHNTKLVYFDNTYAYSQNSKIQTETTELNSKGKKGEAKFKAAKLFLNALEDKKLQGVICRAPEFYGPGKTKGITNTLIFESLKQGKKPKVLLNDRVVRTLIYTPDASKATALIGNTNDCYGQTWHLPCDDDRLTYQEFVEIISNELGRNIKHITLNRLSINLISLFNANLKEVKELLPRYSIDNIFESNKFKEKFPDFRVTTYKDGIKEILRDYGIK